MPSVRSAPTSNRLTEPAIPAFELVYSPQPDDPRVTLELAPDASWVVESYPYESAIESANGTWLVVLAVSEPAWLERLLLSLGPDATVVAPAEFAALAGRAATRLRARYRTK